MKIEVGNTLGRLNRGLENERRGRQISRKESQVHLSTDP